MYFTSWFIHLEPILVTFRWSLGSSTRLGYVDSPLLESLVGDMCLDTFLILVKATDSRLFFLQSSLTNIATISLMDSMVYY